MGSERIRFENRRGQTLAALLDRPQGPVRAHVLFAHCFTCSKDLLAARAVAGALVDAGYAVLRFDFTGLGQSQGDFKDTSFSTNVDDLIDAAEFLEARGGAPRLLVGHSLGGAAVLRAAPKIPSVRAVATIAAPSDPAHVSHLFGEVTEALAERGEVEVKLAGRPFTIRQDFLDDLRAHPMPEVIGQLGRALLVMHAPRDQTVGIEHASTIFTAAKHPKSFVSLDGADHLLTNPEDARFAGSMIAGWAGRYVGEADPLLTSQPAEGRVVAYGPGPKTFETRIEAGHHRLIGDEPVEVGGSDRGPSPYDYLLTALGTCTVMTLRMYAGRKGWPLEQAIAELEHEKVHAKDCEDYDGNKSFVALIRRRLTLVGDLDPEQRARLLEMAGRCPVHRTLEGDIIIRDDLAPSTAPG